MGCGLPDLAAAGTYDVQCSDHPEGRCRTAAAVATEQNARDKLRRQARHGTLCRVWRALVLLPTGGGPEWDAMPDLTRITHPEAEPCVHPLNPR
jgi:hypothetical protein